MAKITYYLGAGASFYSCPILNEQAEMMMALAQYELNFGKHQTVSLRQDIPLSKKLTSNISSMSQS
ncbi:hypothetical protein ACLI09_02935 [Flavobacterium sp. RHBU_24]|uniref:hypothetical protein n=1 Tax=Flavobacterium sp. RHBU_24 TaxID=3391185 RepID=UPI00398554A8